MKGFTKAYNDNNSKTYIEDDIVTDSIINHKKFKKENYFLALERLYTASSKTRKPEQIGTTKPNANVNNSRLITNISVSHNSVYEFSERSRDVQLFKKNQIADKYSFGFFNNDVIFKSKKEKSLIWQYTKDTKESHHKDKGTQASTCRSRISSNLNKDKSELYDLDEENEIPVTKNYICQTSSNSQSEDEQLKKPRKILDSNTKVDDEILVINDEYIHEVENDFKNFNLPYGVNKKNSVSNKKMDKKMLKYSSSKKMNKINNEIISSIKQFNLLNDDDRILDLEEDNSIFIIDEEKERKIEVKKFTDSDKRENINMSYHSPAFDPHSSHNKNLNNEEHQVVKSHFRSITKNLNFDQSHISNKSIIKTFKDFTNQSLNRSSLRISNNDSMSDPRNEFLSFNKTPVQLKELRSVGKETIPRSFKFDSNEDNETIDIDEEEFIPTPVYDIEFIKNLIESDARYKPSYLNSNWLIDQAFASFTERRAIVLDWILEISEEYGFKRDTYHSSVNLFDRYLILMNGEESIESLALIISACMLISSKIEEIQVPRSEEYVNSSNNLFTLDELLLKEQQILNKLQWRINPCTLNTWLNWYISQWDLFVASYSDSSILLIQNENSFLFKKADDYSYHIFRQLTQLLDLISLDIKHLVFENRQLVASCMFLQILNQFKFQEIKEDYTLLSQEEVMNLFEQEGIISIFTEFVRQSFNYSLDDIVESIIFCSQYSSFLNKTTNDLPLCIQMAADDDVEINNGNYEDFLSYQTHNRENISFFMNIQKNQNHN